MFWNKTVAAPKKVKIELYDLPIPLLSLYPREMNTYLHKILAMYVRELLFIMVKLKELNVHQT